jgi:hypothetical protein
LRPTVVKYNTFSCRNASNSGMGIGSLHVFRVQTDSSLAIAW